MKRALRFLPALSVLALPILFIVCAGNPTDPFGGTNTGGGGGGNNPPASSTVTVTATRFDLAADGVDSVVMTATAKDEKGNPVVNGQILWSLQTRGYSGAPGRVSSSSSVTSSSGQASAGYTAPSLDFVPVGAIVIVSATLNLPGNSTASPRGSVTFLLRPKGNAPTTGTGPTGEPAVPVITSVTPNQINVGANPPVTVVVQGLNFDQASQILLVTSDRLETITPQFFSSTQLRFVTPTGLPTGSATLFVTAPGNLLSSGFTVTLTGAGGGTDVVPSISAILPNQGPVGAATQVVILGTDFSLSCQGGTGVVTFIGSSLGKRDVCPSSVSQNRLVLTAPVSPTVAETVSVFVLNDDGKASSPVTFTYVPNNVNGPQISALTPDQGPTTGETRVVITGSNFKSSDSVVIAGPNIFSQPGDNCADGFPVCSNNQCVLNAARGLCTINGTANQDPFEFKGPGQLEILTPSVGTSAAGPADLLVRNTGGDASGAATFTFTAPASLLPPTISQTSASSFSGKTTWPDGSWSLVIQGTNFRKCSSVVITSAGNGGRIYEILPTPDVSDCGVRRGSTSQESPRERLQRILPGDGMTISCGGRPDLIPLRYLGTSNPKTYMHDLICDNATSTPQTFDNVHVASMIAAPPDDNDVTSGGAMSWINETEIRIFFGPRQGLGCESSGTAQIYVSNDPGRGLSGDLISNPRAITFANTTACPTPTPALSISSLVPETGTCLGGNSVDINGTGFITGQNIVRVNGVPLTPSQITSESSTQITITMPPAPPTCSYGTTATPCPVTVEVEVNGSRATATYGYTTTDSIPPITCCQPDGGPCSIGTDCCSNNCSLGTCVP